MFLAIASSSVALISRSSNGLKTNPYGSAVRERSNVAGSEEAVAKTTGMSTFDRICWAACIPSTCPLRRMSKGTMSGLCVRVSV